MALLKEDGSLDIERINRLPYEDYMEEIENMTDEEYKEYCSKSPIIESYDPVIPIKVDYGFEDERSGVDADIFLSELKRKYGVK